MSKNKSSKKTAAGPEQSKELIGILKERFEKNMNRHKGIKWADVETKAGRKS